MCERNEIAPSRYEGLTGDDYFVALLADDPDDFGFHQIIPKDEIPATVQQPAAPVTSEAADDIESHLTPFGRHYYLRGLKRAIQAGTRHRKG
jgi:hypothetical protein